MLEDSGSSPRVEDPMYRASRSLCFHVGNMGFRCADTHRRTIMTIALILQMLILLLSIAGSLSLHRRTDLVMLFGLAESNKDLTSSVYVGLNSIVFDTKIEGIDTLGVDFDGDLCQLSFCQDCEDISTYAVTTSILAGLCNVPQLVRVSRRMRDTKDYPGLKRGSLWGCILHLVLTAVTLYCFETYCVAEIPSSLAIPSSANAYHAAVGQQVPMSVDVDFEYGNGFFAFFIAFCMSAVQLFIMSLTPPPEEISEEEEVMIGTEEKKKSKKASILGSIISTPPRAQSGKA